MRRETFRLISMSLLMLGVAFFAAGCGASTNPNVLPVPVLPPIPTIPLSADKISATVAEFYPGISSRKPLSATSFITRNGMDINVLSYTQQSLNPNVVSDLFDFYDSLLPSAQTKEGYRTTMVINGQTVLVIIYSRQIVLPTNNRFGYVLVPQDFPKPGWAGDTFSSAQSYPDGDPQISVLRAVPNTSDPIATSIDLNNTKGVAAESCHKKFTGGVPGSTPTAVRAIEGFCNSLGHAFAARVKRMSFDAYSSVMSKLVYATFKARAFILSQNDYNRMPSSPVIIGAK